MYNTVSVLTFSVMLPFILTSTVRGVSRHTETKKWEADAIMELYEQGYYISESTESSNLEILQTNYKIEIFFSDSVK